MRPLEKNRERKKRKAAKRNIKSPNRNTTRKVVPSVQTKKGQKKIGQPQRMVRSLEFGGVGSGLQAGLGVNKKKKKKSNKKKKRGLERKKVLERRRTPQKVKKVEVGSRTSK